MSVFLSAVVALGLLALLSAILSRREAEPMYVDDSWRVTLWRREHGGTEGLR
jgi:hypothetical protein